MDKYLRWLDKVLTYWCILLISLMTIGVIASVCLRYVFGITFVWAEAAITMLFVGTTYFGAVLGVRENEHIGISYLLEKFPRRAQKYIQSFAMLVIIVVQIVLFRASLAWINKVGSTRDIALDMPKAYFYAMVPISTVLIILYAGVKLYAFLFEANGSESIDRQAASVNSSR